MLPLPNYVWLQTCPPDICCYDCLTCQRNLSLITQSVACLDSPACQQQTTSSLQNLLKMCCLCYMCKRILRCWYWAPLDWLPDSCSCVCAASFGECQRCCCCDQRQGLCSCWRSQAHLPLNPRLFDQRMSLPKMHAYLDTVCLLRVLLTLQHAKWIHQKSLQMRFCCLYLHLTRFCVCWYPFTTSGGSHIPSASAT